MRKLNASTLGVALWALIAAVPFVLLQPLAQSLLLSADVQAKRVLEHLGLHSLVVAQIALLVLVMTLALRRREATTGLIAALVLSVVVYFLQRRNAGDYVPDISFALFPLVAGLTIAVAAPVDSKQTYPYLGAAILAVLGCALHIEIVAREDLSDVSEQISTTIILAFTIYGPAALVGTFIARVHAFASAELSESALPCRTASGPADTAAST